MKNKNSKHGFTLIETIVAVAILSAAVAGPMVLSIKNIGTASVSQDQLVAFYLGQEVVEYVRNVRDTNIINASSDWLNGLSACKGVSGCYIDIKNNIAPIVCDPDPKGCPKIKFNENLKNYNYQPVVAGLNKETSFIRTVKIDNSIRTDGDEAKISIALKWTSKYGEKTMILQDNIFNWR